MKKIEAVVAKLRREDTEVLDAVYKKFVELVDEEEVKRMEIEMEMDEQ